MKLLTLLTTSLLTMTFLHGAVAQIDTLTEPLEPVRDPNELLMEPLDVDDRHKQPHTDMECEPDDKLCTMDEPWLQGTQSVLPINEHCRNLQDHLHPDTYELIAPVCDEFGSGDPLPEPPVPLPFTSLETEQDRYLGFDGADVFLRAKVQISGMGLNLTSETTLDASARIGGEDVPPPEPGQVPCSDPRGCPDLLVDSSRLLVGDITERSFGESSCAVEEGTTQPGDRRLLRFTFTAPNFGRGDLTIGAPGDHPDWFEFGECHEHWHFESFADYRLWTLDGYAEWQIIRSQDPEATASEVFDEHPELRQEMVSGHKQAFCLMDVRVYIPFSDPNYRNCSSNQGISVGWADEYHHGLDGQWVDITDVEGGLYVLEAEVNPDRIIQESDYTNNAGAVIVEVPPFTPAPSIDPLLEEELECDTCLPNLGVDEVRLASSLTYTTETFGPDNCNVEEGNTQPGTRDLIRFTTKIPNTGNASLNLGDPDGHPDFHWGECHGHWHYNDFVDHRLWNLSAYAEWKEIREAEQGRPADELLDDHPHLRDGLVAGHKMGFCLIDVERVFILYPDTPRRHTSCANQGISAGWADVYSRTLGGQFIDVTGVEPGLYVLELEVNPGRTIAEGDYGNNAAAVFVPIL